jgi:hypothetical protein
MNARFDLLASPASSYSVATPAAACCPRYVAGSDTAPGLFGEIAILFETIAEALVRAIHRAVQGASYPRS